MVANDTQTIQTALAAAKTTKTLRIHYPDVTVEEAGTNVSIAGAKPTPTLSIATSVLKPSTKYILVSIDLDAPFPSFAFMSPILHGLDMDLIAGTSEGADGFVPLQRGQKKEKEEEEEWMVPYRGPGPPRPSTAHRYVFLVFEQPAALDAAKVRALLGWGPEVGLWPRVRWDADAFEKKLGLAAPVAANYYLTRAG